MNAGQAIDAAEHAALREFFDAYVGLEVAYAADAVRRAIARFNLAKRAVLKADDSKEANAVHVIGATSAAAIRTPSSSEATEGRMRDA